MAFWANKTVVVAFGGGIAAYKTLELIRLLREQGARVWPVLTASATQFVTPLTVQALAGHPVYQDLFTPQAADGMDHIRLAQEADLLIIAPATANRIAKLASGLADDLLSALALVRRKPIVLAPAMNSGMWQHPATQRNISQLQADGLLLVGPESGALACGEQGVGRMAEAERILEAGRRLLSPKILLGHRILLTAGPTREELDPVRYISNRSSGRMGWAIAQAALRAGAEVTLIHGAVEMAPPWGAEALAVESAQEMYEATLQQWDKWTRPGQQLSCAILTAAVADYRPASRRASKIKKELDGELSLKLTQNPDILLALGERANRLAQKNRARPLLVGFAAETAETEDAAAQLVPLAKEKLARKGCDLLLLNNVLAPGCAFGSLTNQVTLLHRSGQQEIWPLLAKEEIGERLVQTLQNRL
ncbi:bifunctional phosphopantothenoylcysteine decarboxylase/phosphopantothenate--cysteine ligase CoaBC [Candidatus Magnetaquicoccus inordinatus]|uniref:bifunctional phosphopantothenoylcysteine decarboxylase/phosphopantothenate--cysteine ligase CoaBC n=1 Tax=Candidatus Magnetaquicoccus inordinatus TaxID=2496818 RepID=UPI00102C74BC|nr:bifunctional phosphopantothenoylcysteine decarboxylase/phosphopantothenate--cysteine ligase CoaBC [Candidatus Magnetaquicoccus inordinatus]